jgi:hypothetical protein
VITRWQRRERLLPHANVWGRSRVQQLVELFVRLCGVDCEDRRRSGLDREVELWWATDGTTVYLISGGGDRPDWVRNLLAFPQATLRTRGGSLAVTARLPVRNAA